MKQRIQRVNKLIKKELGKILLKEVDFPANVLVTITRTDVSADLNQVKVYISCLPEKQTLRVLKILNKNLSFIQKKINQILTMKKVPKIEFIEEKKTKIAARIEELLEGIKENN